MVRDLDLAEPHVADTRRLEVVADGLPLFGWGPVGHRYHDCEHTPCKRRSAKCPRGWGSPVRSSTTQRKDLPRTHRSSKACSFGVLGVEVCGRWSVETQSFLSIGTREGTLLEAFAVEACGTGVATSVGVLDFLHGCTCCERS